MMKNAGMPRFHMSPASIIICLMATPRSLALTTIPSPLCVEEFDLSDRNFRPCPCGYQVRYARLLSLVVFVLIFARYVNFVSTILETT